MTSIRPALEAADKALDLELQRRATIGHLRHTAREIAKNLFGIQVETGEVVTLQDQFEKVLNAFIQSQASPTMAHAYVAPEAVRARIDAMTLVNKETHDGE